MIQPPPNMRYLLAEATIDQSDLNELADWLRTNPWLTQGQLVREFEGQWAQWLGARYATFVNSGSSANLLMYYAALLSGKLKNRKVVVPALSWATTVAPALQLGFEPIMCDADSVTLGMDLQRLERILQAQDPAAVILVHTLGIPNDMDGLMRLKERYGFLLMEDCCPALGSRYRGQMVGTFGEMSSMSFYFGHHLSTIEGGMVSTNDEELHDLFLHTRSHGWAKDLDPEKEEHLARERDVLPFNRIFTFYHPGFNVRSTDLNAKIGLGQMRKADWVVQRRIENHRRYEERFRGASDYHVPVNKEAVTCSISFVALAKTREHRDRLAVTLREHGIETRPLGGGSMGRQPFWVDRMGLAPFPVADRVHESSFMLPNHPYLSLQDVDDICDVVLAVKA
ncbi:MAG: DegT/DnrJ/EryC1/StrS family aminotransferase [Chloroflexi bacterium]|nr:DegT/DnrJ/EryC1/StrS family aminotransferase [Chloroflexota bacterium]